MTKDTSYTESQKLGKRQREDKHNPTGPSSRRKLSIEDVPETLRDVEGGILNELQTWRNTSAVRTIQQAGEASRGKSHGDGNVLILLNVLDGRKLKLTTVAHRGEENPQLRNEGRDRKRWVTQWYDFRMQVREGSIIKLMSKYKF